MEEIITMEALNKLKKDVKQAAKTLSGQEARYLVDTYYQIQEYRKRTVNQCRKLETTPEGEPNSTLQFFSENFDIMERNMKSTLKSYVESQPIGVWLTSICGIGEVIAAGLIAHIDIKKVQTAGQIWAFAGLDPTKEWKKGEVRPWNAKLKTLCWKIGESFVKVSNNEKDIYGKIYRERKEYETAKNEAGDYAEQAKLKLEKFKIGKDTEAYKWYSQGKLPPAHINERAKRYAVKIFLSHLFDVWYRLENGCEPPKPFAIAILGHVHMIDAPNQDLLK